MKRNCKERLGLKDRDNLHGIETTFPPVLLIKGLSSRFQIARPACKTGKGRVCVTVVRLFSTVYTSEREKERKRVAATPYLVTFGEYININYLIS